MVRERVPEHGFIGNGLRSRVDEFGGAAGSVPYNLDRVHWRDAIMGLEITSRAVRECV